MSTLIPVTDVTPDLIARMPKVELHLHLEGSIDPATVLELARRNTIDLGVRTAQETEALYAYRDFPHFIDTFVRICECLRRPEDFTLVVERLGARLAAQNVRYAEVHFNPEPHLRKRGIAFGPLLDAMNVGRRVVRARHGVKLRWIADGIRDADSGPVSVTRTVDWMIESGHERGVVALGLGGLEDGYPAARFADDFARARAAGFHVTVHAGEITGPEAIRETVKAIEPDRIGHGIAAVHDPALMSDLARRQIPLEVCPVSNLRTGAVARLEDLRLRELDEAGVILTLNTDDPPMFHTSMTNEFAVAADVFGFTLDDLHRFTLNAAHAAFLPPNERETLVARIDAEYSAMLKTAT
jgi:adenosine deaminase